MSRAAPEHGRRVPRFFAPLLPGVAGEPLELEGEEAHHATHVLRLPAGALVEVFDGAGGAGTFEVRRATRGALSLVLVRRTDESREATCAVTLAFAPPRPKRTLALVEKATELGVARLVPLETARTRAALGPRAIEKLRRRAIEASKQCGRNRLPELTPSVTLAGLVAGELGRVELALLPDTRGARPIAEALRERAKPVASALVAVGPEGGFDDEERTLLRGAGFVPVIFGSATLRVETAAIAVLTCLRYELG